MEGVPAPEGVTYETGHAGGIPGVWRRPENARPEEVLLHIHGGWFNWGSAYAFRHLAGHIAAEASVQAFVPDYRLAPEHPFTKIAVTGDSAGGTLALGLLAFLNTSSASARSAIVAGVSLSPVTDLSLSGGSWSTRALADPYFTRPQVTELVRSYL